MFRDRLNDEDSPPTEGKDRLKWIKAEIAKEQVIFIRRRKNIHKYCRAYVDGYFQKGYVSPAAPYWCYNHGDNFNHSNPNCLQQHPGIYLYLHFTCFITCILRTLFFYKIRILFFIKHAHYACIRTFIL